MKSYLLYGALLAVTGFLLTLILFICGLQSDVGHMKTGQWVGGLVGLVAGVTFIVLGIKARREAVPPDQEFGYGWALWAGLATQLYASAFGIVTTYVYVAFINPNLTDLILRAQAEQAGARGMSSEQIEKMQAVSRHFFGPTGQAISTFFITLFFGFVIALVVAGFLRRPSRHDPMPV